MSLEELYQLIGLQPEVIEKLKLCADIMDPAPLELSLRRMTERETAPQAYEELKKLLGEDEGNFKMLYCHLTCACRIWEKYQEKGIPLQIYTATMRCFARFLSECRHRRGVMFFDRGWWTCRQVSLSLLRIGTLEYELIRCEKKDMIGVHIPSDADLSPDSVDESLRLAEDFFDTYFPEYRFETYRCDSWLLSQPLAALLPAASNILAFQKRFRIVSENPQGRGVMEWLFRVPDETAYEQLPEDTGLQKKVKALLLAGGSVGTACGLMNRPKIC